MLVPWGSKNKYWADLVSPNVYKTICLQRFAFKGYDQYPRFSCVLLFFEPGHSNTDKENINRTENMKEWAEEMRKAGKYEELLDLVRLRIKRLDEA